MGKVMNFEVGSVKVKLIEEGDRICGHVAAGNLFEPDSLKWWGEFCSHSKTVIDVGGYSGLFSIAAAKMGCRVICFEPMPLNAARIIENCRLNKVTIELHQAVASDKIGMADLTFNPHVEGMTSGASLIRRKGVKIPVKSLTIDSLNLSPDVIKIDVERGEPLVLAGAKATLARSKPALIVEVLDKEREELVKNSVENYLIHSVIDVRNWVMLPCSQ